MPYRKLWFLLVILGLVSWPAVPVHSQGGPTAERIAFSAFRNGQWDLYTIAPDGSEPRQLTDDNFEDTDPAYSPDGTKIAFASRRDRNWDIYLLDLLTGEESRLTTSPHYDGAPAWSPDGKSLAYESYQGGDLDIWRLEMGDADGAVNLTGVSTAGEFAPAWSPDGRSIAFTSWRNGNKDLYLLDIDRETISQLTDSPTSEEGAVWHPQGDRLALAVDDLGDRELFSLDVEEAQEQPGLPQAMTWLGRTDSPAWSPDGQRVAAIFHRWDGDVIIIQDGREGRPLPRELTEPIFLQGRLTWHAQAVDFGRPVPALVNPDLSALYDEPVVANEDQSAEPYNLVRLDDLKVGTPWLADTVDDSFQAWRFRLRDEVGYDFLGELSDALREVSQRSDTTQYASWHKSGRAVDTLFDYYVDGELFHEIVREDYSGETYWRIMLRCLDQSGRCGRPLTANPWNYSERARTVLAPEQGGLEKANLSGYYVDMTALAREYGWNRISSYDDEEYSWHWHFLAFEYWHYQKRLETGPAVGNGANGGTVNWYRAMQDVYPVETLEEYFNWETMRAAGDDPYLIALKGVPLPLEMKPWWNLIQP